MPLLKAVVGGALSGLGEGITRAVRCPFLEQQGGALAGLGEGITRRAKRMEGVRLRDKYMMDRMKVQQGFQAGESELNRDFTGGGERADPP